MQAPVVILHLVANNADGSITTHLEVLQPQGSRPSTGPEPQPEVPAPTTAQPRPDVKSFPTDVPEVESSTWSLAEPEADSPDKAAQLRAHPILAEQSPVLPFGLSPASDSAPGSPAGVEPPQHAARQAGTYAVSGGEGSVSEDAQDLEERRAELQTTHQTAVGPYAESSRASQQHLQGRVQLLLLLKAENCSGLPVSVYRPLNAGMSFIREPYIRGAGCNSS